MNREPLIIDFQTESGNYYVYDVGTNQTNPVEKLDIDIIKNYRKMSLEEIKSSFKNYSTDQIELSYQKVALWIEKGGMFFTDWSKNNIMEMPSKQKYFQNLANSNQLTLEMTQKCNLRCKYCVYSDNFDFLRSHSNKTMSWEVAKRSIDYFFELIDSPWKTYTGDVCIGFYGGEPLIEYELIKKCVEYCKLKDCDVRISHNMTTNGTLLTEEIINFLIKHEINLLISLDGPESEHNKHRIYQTGEGSFSKIDTNLEMILKTDKIYYKKYVHFNSVYSPLTDLEQVISYFAQKIPKINLRVKNILPMSPEDGKFYKSISTSNKNNLLLQASSLFEKYIDLEKRGEKDNPLLWTLRTCFGESYPKFKVRKHTYPEIMRFKGGSCVPGFKKLFVDANGRFHACERIPPNFSIGDCWNGIIYEKVKKHFENYVFNVCQECHHCIAVNNCSICFVNTVINGFSRKDQCEIVKKLFKLTLIEIYTILEKNQYAFNN